VVFKHPAFIAASYTAVAREFSEEFSPAVELVEVEDFVFVLKPLKDRAARLAMAVYAEAVRHEKPRLAAELNEILDDFDGS